jgi:hypothetical protein
LLTREYPVPGRTLDDVRATLRQHGARKLRTLRPDLPDAVTDVVDRALAPDPASRYEDASALAAAPRCACRCRFRWWHVGDAYVHEILPNRPPIDRLENRGGRWAGGNRHRCCRRRQTGAGQLARPRRVGHASAIGRRQIDSCAEALGFSVTPLGSVGRPTMVGFCRTWIRRATCSFGTP